MLKIKIIKDLPLRLCIIMSHAVILEESMFRSEYEWPWLYLITSILVVIIALTRQSVAVTLIVLSRLW